MAYEEAAWQLANEIGKWRKGLQSEEEMLTSRGPHTCYVRARKYRDLDQARINSTVIALTCVLDAPPDMRRTEAFIANETRTAAP